LQYFALNALNTKLLVQFSLLFWRSRYCFIGISPSDGSSVCLSVFLFPKTQKLQIRIWW